MNIAPFLDKGKLLAIVGASDKPDGFGFKIYKDLKGAKFNVVPVNINYEKVQGDKCYPTLLDLPDVPYSVNIITPPKVTIEVVKQALKLGIKHIWMQPGADHQEAIQAAEQAKAVTVFGRCIMVERRLGLHKDPFDEIMDQMDEYEEGTTPRTAQDTHCGCHED